MKILALADTEEPFLWDYYSAAKVKDVDLILSCGDLKKEYLEFLVTMINRPLLYVHGNHDERFESDPPLGCDCIDDKVVEVCGYRIGGLGGSMRYRPDAKYMYTERKMSQRVAKLRRQIKKAGGIDILVTHAPASDWGDLEDIAHQGFACFHEILKQDQPQVMFYGHVHRSYGDFTREREYPGGIRLINAGGYYFLDLPDRRPSSSS